MYIKGEAVRRLGMHSLFSHLFLFLPGEVCSRQNGLLSSLANYGLRQ